MSTHTLNPMEMFGELVRQGLVVPVGEHPDLMLPSAYRSVPTMTSSGTGHIRTMTESQGAKLDSATKGNIEDTR